MRVRRWLRWPVGTAIAVPGLATVIGFLDRFAWRFELVTAFRLHYAGLLVALVLPALVLRLPRMAAAAAFLAVVNLAVVAGEPSTQADASGPAAPLRLVIANVQVGNDQYDQLVRLVREVRPDVLGVIELNASWKRELTRRLPAFRERLTVAREDAYGIGVFSRLPVDSRVERFPSVEGPPTIVARLRPRRGAPLTFVLTHVHTLFAGSIHERHLDALAAARPRFGERVVVCGDFNTVPWAASFRRLAGGRLADLYDGWWPGYSWPTWSRLVRLPIDNCLVGGVGIRGHSRGPDIGSDHYPLVVDLAVPIGP